MSGDEIRESSNVTSGSSGSNSSNNIYPLTSHREISGFDPRYHDVVLQYHGDMKDFNFTGTGASYMVMDPNMKANSKRGSIMDGECI